MPLFGSRRDQDRARLRARVAKLRIRVGHGRAAAGTLNGAESKVVVKLGIGRSAFHGDLRPVGVEFLRKNGRKASVRALSHFQMLGDHRDAVVGADSYEGIRREGSARCGGRWSAERA